ncbi:hypothetical protein BCR33DRAFT_771803, partial [Rhizoclosmatium globosum]
MKLFLLASLAFLASSSPIPSGGPQSLYSCTVKTQEQADALLHFDVFNHRFGPNAVVDVRTRSATEAAKLKSLLSCTLKNADIYKVPEDLGDANAIQRAAAVDPFFSDYQRYSTIISKLVSWNATYSNVLTYVPSIAVSHQGRNVPAIIITDKSVPSSAKKTIWWNGMMHAREWISPATVMWIANNLLTGSSSDATIASWLKQFQFVITPMNNPDGYEYTFTTDRMWRKNLRDNGDGTLGVDLNRNWDDGHWGQYGTTTTTSDETYCGPSPFSEPETIGTANFISTFPNLYSGIDFHSYSELVLRSWGWTNNDSPNEAILKQLGDGIVSAIYGVHQEQYTSEKAAALYLASGVSDDWMSTKLGMAGFTIELRDTGNYGFQLPNSFIAPVGEEIWGGIKFYIDFLVKNPNIPPQYPTTKKTTTTTVKAATSTTAAVKTTTVATTCAHSKCVSGVALRSSCDACVGKIIAQDSYCGSTSWDSVCVGEVKSICGITC